MKYTQPRQLIVIVCMGFYLFFMQSCNPLSNGYERSFKTAVKFLDGFIKEVNQISDDESITKRYFKNNSEVVITQVRIDRALKKIENSRSEIKANIKILQKVFSEKNDWQYDALFCASYIELTLASITRSENDIEQFLKTMQLFAQYDKSAKVNPWTRANFANIFWVTSKDTFSKKLSEKENLNIFFRLGGASLMISQKKFKQAFEICKEVLTIIDKNGFFALQAQNLLKMIEDNKNAN